MRTPRSLTANFRPFVLRKGERIHDIEEEADIYLHEPGCCGIHELNMEDLGINGEEYDEDGDKYVVPDYPFSVASIASHISSFLLDTVKDSRMIFCGVPTAVMEDSQYNISFYLKARKALRRLGFREVGAPYKNENSGNEIVAMVVRMPGR